MRDWLKYVAKHIQYIYVYGYRYIEIFIHIEKKCDWSTMLVVWHPTTIRPPPYKHPLSNVACFFFPILKAQLTNVQLKWHGAVHGADFTASSSVCEWLFLWPQTVYFAAEEHNVKWQAFLFCRSINCVPSRPTAAPAAVTFFQSQSNQIHNP